MTRPRCPYFNNCYQHKVVTHSFENFCIVCIVFTVLYRLYRLYRKRAKKIFELWITPIFFVNIRALCGLNVHTNP